MRTSQLLADCRSLLLNRKLEILANRISVGVDNLEGLIRMGVINQTEYYHLLFRIRRNAL
jgi:hypothetical protein